VGIICNCSHFESPVIPAKVGIQSVVALLMAAVSLKLEILPLVRYCVWL